MGLEYGRGFNPFLKQYMKSQFANCKLKTKNVKYDKSKDLFKNCSIDTMRFKSCLFVTR